MTWAGLFQVKRRKRYRVDETTYVRNAADEKSRVVGGDRAKAFRRLETPSSIKSHYFKTNFFFSMWAIFQLIIEFVTILLLFYVFVFFWPQGVWDISFPTGPEPPRPVVEGKVLTIRPPEKSQQSLLQFQFRVKREATSFSKAETLKGKFVLIIPPHTCFWLTLGWGHSGWYKCLFTR